MDLTKLLTDDEKAAVMAAVRDARNHHDDKLRDLGRKMRVTTEDGTLRSYHDKQSKILTGVLVKLYGGAV